ncbi:MAG: lipid II:glycine glycyltransferase FemX [Candidatus Promineifilaceae bacterium]|jgi:lipid II:glycine glycyltransferase (peptidoglycan interpeptide bridge formation enzyme)
MSPSEPIFRASTFKEEKSEVAWNQALVGQPYAHALQSWVWGDFKSRWGWTAQRLTLTIAEGSWEPLGAAQVLKRRLPRLPYSILYVPKGPALDYTDQGLRLKFLEELEKLARREKAILIKIDPEVVSYWGVEKERKSPVGEKLTQELQSRGWLYSAEQIQFPNTVIIDLMRSEEDLLASMKSKTRYNIRLAGRKGITVRQGTADDLNFIAKMYQETADRDEFAIRPRDYYLDAWRSFYNAGMAMPLLAEYEGEPVAAVLLIRFGDRVTYMYGASTNRERQRMPNYLLQWEAIRWAKAQGCKIYDFWGAPTRFEEDDPLWGVWRFKDGFQGDVVWHIGAWDFPARPFWYNAYARLLPRYIAFLRSRNSETSEV